MKQNQKPKLYFLPQGIIDCLEAEGNQLQPLLTISEIHKHISEHDKWMISDAGTILASSLPLKGFPFTAPNKELQSEIADGDRDMESLVVSFTGNNELLFKRPETSAELTGYISEDNEAIVYFSSEYTDTSLLEDLLHSLTITKSIDRALTHPLWRFASQSFPIQGNGIYCGYLSK